MPNFTDILLAARRRIIANETPALQAQFYKLYLLALNRQLARVQPGDVQTEAEAKEFLRQAMRQVGLYVKASEVTTYDAIIRILTQTIDAHKAALRALEQEAGAQINMTFTGISREAFENLFLRRSMGLTASYKSLTVDQVRRTGRVIEDALEAMVTDGDSWQRATQRIIDGLTTGDPELLAMAKAMGRKSRGLGRWLESATNEAEETAIKAARKIAYDARRIARTEVAHAYHEADRVVSARSPVVKALQWNLSDKHPKPDICDVLAKHDFFGMGPGVYPPEYLPPLPHPHDLCYNTHVLWAPGEWRKPHPPPEEPAELTAGDVARYMPKGTKGAIDSTLAKVNGTFKRLIELQTIQETT